MGEGHFDDAIGGCAGGQFAEAPPFALWTVFPCLRWTLWFYLSRIPVILFLFVLGMYALTLALISGVFSCACLPLSTPLYLILNLEYFDCSVGGDFFAFPGMALFGLVSTICLMIIEILWLPFAFVISLILIPCQCLTSGQNDDENSMPYWKCCSECKLSPFWFFPFFCLQNLLNGLGGLGDD